MARLIVQSMATGRFLCPSESGNEPVWVPCLRAAGGGVVADLESARQLVLDHCDGDDMPILIDLDRLGTANDYVDGGA